ncbi:MULTISPECIES: CsbD family protein [unclassified Thioalkalivibrio]|uniref:CsbD family protein n=1 Tax=unclassified Thioalkalivibrio TaxID=2621013 RepID=UPI0003671B29|nr:MULTISPECIES: CsbD family protein [unclassified Thioalkalivibrio]
MNWDIVKGNWKQFKGKVKARWGKLTDDELETVAGKREELAGHIQERYGVTKDEAEQQIKEFEKKLDREKH